MPLDASIYRQFAPQQGSALDVMRGLADLDAQREARQTNALQRMVVQQGLADRQQASDRANALSRLQQSLGGRSQSEVLAGLRSAGYFGEADAMEKAQLANTETQGKITKQAAETTEAGARAQKLFGEAQSEAIKRYRGALDFVDTPAGAARWLQAQYADPMLAEQMGSLGTFEQAVQRIPQDPQGFAEWRGKAAMGMERWAAQQLEQQKAAETAKNNAETRALQRRGQDITLRGQNMADARARDANALAAQEFGPSRAPVLGVPSPTVVPWANQTNARDANKVKAAEATRGAKELEKDDDVARKAAATAADARRFMELNARVNTGGVTDKLGITRAAQGLGAEYAELEAITARLVPGMREPGSGASSDLDVKMFERGTVGVDKPRATNDAIAEGLMARAQQMQDYVSFRQTYLEQNGTLQGADRFWKGYVDANPIFDKTSKTPKLNKNRQGWREHFAGQAGAPAPAPAPSGDAPKVVDWGSLK